MMPVSTEVLMTLFAKEAAKEIVKDKLIGGGIDNKLARRDVINGVYNKLLEAVQGYVNRNDFIQQVNNLHV